MRVVGRADDDRVDLRLQVVEHLAEVGELLACGYFSKALPARVSSTSHRATMFSPLTPRQVGRAPAAGADDGDVQLLVRPRGAVPCEGRDRRSIRRRRPRRG